MASTAAPTAEGGQPPLRIRGTLTITRAASLQREIDAEPDPLVIDLSGVERMDTVGAWLVYRAVRDRGAKVVGATPEAQSLVEQVAEFDKPVQVHPDERGGFVRVLSELGEWITEAGRTLVGLVDAIRVWAEANIEAVLEAQRAFDSRPPDTEDAL